MKPKKPPASPERRARWRATNALRERITDAFPRTLRGRPKMKKFDWASHVDDCGPTPPRLLQFWDKDPPKEVQRMFEHTGEVCKRMGFAHDVLDLAAARERMVRFRDGAWAVHFDRAPHPSMQADLLRIVDLYADGGMYLDADMVLKRPLPFALPPSPFFIQWASGHRTNVANWFLASPKGHPVFAAILDIIDERLSSLPIDDNGRYVSANLISETGPGPVSHAVENHLRERPQARDLVVIPVLWSREFVHPGRRFLNGPVAYKRSGRHWKLPRIKT
ncbi:MAG: glycosyltransferase [Pseudomonadota bacterium]